MQNRTTKTVGFRWPEAERPLLNAAAASAGVSVATFCAAAVKRAVARQLTEPVKVEPRERDADRLAAKWRSTGGST